MGLIGILSETARLSIRLANLEIGFLLNSICSDGIQGK